MIETLRIYKTPKGEVEAWFMNKKNRCDVQYGLIDSRLKKVVPEDKFLKIVKEGKWKQIKGE